MRVLQTIAYADYVAAGNEKRAKELGKVRFEGTSYVVQDGDVILFHHRK
jgi:ribosome-binding ATPase YchF (GTP1/OBG family)